MVFVKYFPERFLQSKPISMNTEASIESVCIKVAEHSFAGGQR